MDEDERLGDNPDKQPTTNLVRHDYGSENKSNLFMSLLF